MENPPGISFLYRISPFLLLPSATVIGLLQLNHLCSGPTIPTWLVTLGILLARPLLSIYQRYYQRYVDKKAAAANNAFIIPHVHEERPNFAGLSLIAAMVKDMEEGYVGEIHEFVATHSYIDVCWKVIYMMAGGKNMGISFN